MTEDTNVVDKTYPVNVEIVYPQRSSRLQALLALAVFPKLLLLIPHCLILMLLGCLSLLAATVGLLLILLTGKYPHRLFDFQVGVLRWNTRVTAWSICLVDKYPPFRIYS
jgi:hypothetical protein